MTEIFTKIISRGWEEEILREKIAKYEMLILGGRNTNRVDFASITKI